MPASLDPTRPPQNVGSVFDPNSPANLGVDRANYGTLQQPVSVSLPTGPVDADLFIEGSKDRVIDFSPTPSDRQAIEDFQKHPAYDPNQLEVVILDRLTRLAVDRELFGD